MIWRLGAYNVQPVQELKPGYNLQGLPLVEEIDRNNYDADFLKKIMSSDEAIIHVSLECHRHNGKILVLKIHTLLKKTHKGLSQI